MHVRKESSFLSARGAKDGNLIYGLTDPERGQFRRQYVLSIGNHDNKPRYEVEVYLAEGTGRTYYCQE